MAELLVDGDDLVLRLTRLEKLEAVHGDLRAPLASVRSIEVLVRSRRRNEAVKRQLERR
jgi:hypothetical protein